MELDGADTVLVVIEMVVGYNDVEERGGYVADKIEYS